MKRKYYIPIFLVCLYLFISLFIAFKVLSKRDDVKKTSHSSSSSTNINKKSNKHYTSCIINENTYYLKNKYLVKAALSGNTSKLFNIYSQDNKYTNCSAKHVNNWLFFCDDSFIDLDQYIACDDEVDVNMLNFSTITNGNIDSYSNYIASIVSNVSFNNLSSTLYNISDDINIVEINNYYPESQDDIFELIFVNYNNTNFKLYSGSSSKINDIPSKYILKNVFELNDKLYLFFDVEPYPESIKQNQTNKLFVLKDQKFVNVN